eukprot:2390823-Amphidinium_carterae.1
MADNRVGLLGPLLQKEAMEQFMVLQCLHMSVWKTIAGLSETHPLELQHVVLSSAMISLAYMEQDWQICWTFDPA